MEKWGRYLNPGRAVRDAGWWWTLEWNGERI